MIILMFPWNEGYVLINSRESGISPLLTWTLAKNAGNNEKMGNVLSNQGSTCLPPGAPSMFMGEHATLVPQPFFSFSPAREQFVHLVSSLPLKPGFIFVSQTSDTPAKHQKENLVSYVHLCVICVSTLKSEGSDSEVGNRDGVGVGVGMTTAAERDGGLRRTYFYLHAAFSCNLYGIETFDHGDTIMFWTTQLVASEIHLLCALCLLVMYYVCKVQFPRNIPLSWYRKLSEKQELPMDWQVSGDQYTFYTFCSMCLIETPLDYTRAIYTRKISRGVLHKPRTYRINGTF